MDVLVWNKVYIIIILDSKGIRFDFTTNVSESQTGERCVHMNVKNNNIWPTQTTTD